MSGEELEDAVPYQDESGRWHELCSTCGDCIRCGPCICEIQREEAIEEDFESDSNQGDNSK